MIFEEKTLESEYIYKGKILNLRKDKVTVVSGESFREIIEHNGAAAVGAITDNKTMIMVKQYRKPLRKVLLEVPAGKRDGDEPFELTAIRELKEETGYSAKNVVYLGDMYPAAGYSEEVVAMYMATGLEKGETNFDPNEAIDIIEYPIDDLVDMVMKGEIKDSKTQIIILKVAEIMREK